MLHHHNLFSHGEHQDSALTAENAEHALKTCVQPLRNQACKLINIFGLMKSDVFLLLLKVYLYFVYPFFIITVCFFTIKVMPHHCSVLYAFTGHRKKRGQNFKCLSEVTQSEKDLWSQEYTKVYTVFSFVLLPPFTDSEV